MSGFEGEQKVAFEALASLSADDALEVVTAAVWCILDVVDESYRRQARRCPRAR